MGVLDKLLDAVKLNDDYEDDLLDDDLLDEEDDDDFLDDDPEETPVRKFFQKFGKKNTDYEDDLDDIDDEPVKSKVKEKASQPKTSASQKSERPHTSSKITPMRSTKRGNQAAAMEVCVIKPTSMEDTSTIVDTLIDNSTVILNVEGLDVELAQRIVDFTSGACYSLGGKLRWVSSYIFILVPYNVDISGDLHNMLSGSSPSVRAGY